MVRFEVKIGFPKEVNLAQKHSKPWTRTYNKTQNQNVVDAIKTTLKTLMPFWKKKRCKLVLPFVSSFVIEEAVSIYDWKNCRLFVQIHLSKGSRNQSDTQGTSIVYLALYPYKPSCSTLLHFISALKNFGISFLLVPKSSFSSVQKWRHWHWTETVKTYFLSFSTSNEKKDGDRQLKVIHVPH